MSKIGYARVSTREQSLDSQLSILSEYGCSIIFKEKVSGVKDRPELQRCLEYLRAGDVLIVYKYSQILI